MQRALCLLGALLSPLLCALPAPVLAQAAASTAASAGSQSPPAARDPAVSIELNKLEDVDKACRGYFVIGNKLPDPLKELQIDLYMFDSKGVIARRVGLSFTDVRSNRTKVVLFDLAGLACADIGRLLVNEVLSCTSAAGPVEDCADRVAVSTKTAVPFEY